MLSLICIFSNSVACLPLTSGSLRKDPLVLPVLRLRTMASDETPVTSMASHEVQQRNEKKSDTVRDLDFLLH